MGPLKRAVAGILLAGAAAAPASAQKAQLLFPASQFGRAYLVLPQSTANLEAVLGRNVNFERLVDYNKTDRLRVLSSPVGRLDLLVERNGRAGVMTCTASILSREYVLTNNHCAPNDDSEEKIRKASLLMNFYGEEQEPLDSRYDIELQPVEQDAALDYAIFRVHGDPSARFGKISLQPRDPIPGEALLIIHHPAGLPKHMTRGGCRAVSPRTVRGTDILHQCDTLPGSSGSPIFASASLEVIGIHYAGAASRVKDSYNFGKRLAKIVEKSKVLAALIRQEEEERRKREQLARLQREEELKRRVAAMRTRLEEDLRAEMERRAGARKTADEAALRARLEQELRGRLEEQLRAEMERRAGARKAADEAALRARLEQELRGRLEEQLRAEMERKAGARKAADEAELRARLERELREKLEQELRAKMKTASLSPPAPAPGPKAAPSDGAPGGGGTRAENGYGLSDLRVPLPAGNWRTFYTFKTDRNPAGVEFEHLGVVDLAGGRVRKIAVFVTNNGGRDRPWPGRRSGDYCTDGKTAGDYLWSVEAPSARQVSCVRFRKFDWRGSANQVASTGTDRILHPTPRVSALLAKRKEDSPFFGFSFHVAAGTRFLRGIYVFNADLFRVDARFCCDAEGRMRSAEKADALLAQGRQMEAALRKALTGQAVDYAAFRRSYREVIRSLQ